MRNTIAFQRGLVLVPAGTAGAADSSALAASLQAELMQLGYMFDDVAFAAARTAPREWLVAWHAEILPHVRNQLGAARAYPPFYRNFPAEVMEADAVDLFVNACVHYVSNGRWEPPQELRNRGIALERTEFKALRLGTDDDLKQLFTKLASAGGSLTAQDKWAVEWLIDRFGPALPMPETIPFKETLCILAGKGLDVPVKTPTDVLRVAVYLSGGDISLPGVPKPILAEPPDMNRWWARQWRDAQQAARDKFKFKKFSRAQRRFILGLLEKTNCDAAEMQRHLGRWVRLGEVLHVGEFAARYPRAAAAFARLRNQHDRASRVRTFAARVDLAFAEEWRTGVDTLAERPGEFARRLDWMLRTAPDDADRALVLDTFARVAPAVSSKVLFELYGHFAQRYRKDAPRAVMIKGLRSKMKTLTPLPPMDADLVQNVGNTILAIMRARIAALPPLGRVWIDPRLRDVPVPFAMRSVNTAVKTYVRGTRVPFREDALVVRAFVHWFDEHGNEDLDLSAALYDENLKQVAHISFTNLRLAELNCCHSGDVRHRKGACAEYVDLDVVACLASGVRYAAVQVYNYDGRPMHTVKECVFGLTEREFPEAGEIFVPRTIANCMPLANEGTTVVACVVDLRAGNYVWADVEADRSLATIENTASATADVLRALIHGTRMSVHELLTLHARARGTLVDDAASADLVLRWEDLVTDYSGVLAYMTF